MPRPAALAQLATWTLAFTPMACLAPPERAARRHRREPAPVRRLAAARGAPRGRRACAGLREPRSASHRRRAPRSSSRAPATRRRRRPRAACRRVLAPLSLALLDLDDATPRHAARRGRHDVRRRPRALPRDGACAPLRSRASSRSSIARSARTPDPRASFVPPPRFAGRLDAAGARATASRRSASACIGWCAISPIGSLARGLGVMRADARARSRALPARSAGCPPPCVPFALGAPARGRRRIFIGVLRERLARVALPAPVEAITLASDETAPLAGRNLGLLPGDDADARRRAARRSPARAARRGRARPLAAARRASSRACDARCGAIDAPRA